MLDLRRSSDGTLSAYDVEFDECYHSLKDGAMIETLFKHIIPAFELITHNGAIDKATSGRKIKILDICFGLGYNSLFSLAYAKKLGLCVEIYSVESNLSLFSNLTHFTYPKILWHYLNVAEILESIKNHSHYSDNFCSISVHKGDACEFIAGLESEFFDIIYQDAFSPSKNPKLWSLEHFSELFRILCKNGIITTYSSAKMVRENASVAGFHTYNIQVQNLKKGSIFSKIALDSMLDSSKAESMLPKNLNFTLKFA